MFPLPPSPDFLPPSSPGKLASLAQKSQANPELTLLAYYIISDTHMDYGWFAPNILIRRKNFVVLEEVRRKLEEDTEHRFSLEAAWMLEAYAGHSTPGQFESFKRLIQAGQISVAPHFVLLDDRLAGERAQIYNVLVGRRVAARYGLVPSTLFCAKDMFGLDAQTPQREHKLGNDMVFRTRGDVPEVEDAIVHLWLGADGKSWIYDVRQAGGYGSGVRLGHGPMEASATVYSRPRDNSCDIRNEEAAHSIAVHDARFGREYHQCGLQVGVLFNGCDYERLQQDIGEVIDYLRQRFPGVDFRLATFEEYGQLVRCLNPHLLKTYQGPLFGRLAASIRDVDLTHIPTIKAPYVEANRLLADAEALSALATYQGVMEDAQSYLTEIWKDLLAVGTHDYLSGSVTDFVLPEISYLLWAAKEKARRIGREALGRLATGLEVRYNDLEITGESYSLVNLSAYPRAGLVELPIPASLSQTPQLQLRTQAGEILPVQMEANGSTRRALAVVEVPRLRGKQVTLEAVLDGTIYPSEETCEDQRIGTPLPPQRGEFSLTPPFGGTGGLADDKSCKKLKTLSPIENEFLVVESYPGGLVVGKKEPAFRRSAVGGRRSTLWFDLVRDRGDTYTAEALNRPPWDSRLGVDCTGPVKVSRGSLIQTLSFDLAIHAPKKLGADRLSLSDDCGLITLAVTAHLVSGLDHLRLDLTVNNLDLDDYILRLLVGAPYASRRVLARDNFMVRPGSPIKVEEESWQARNSYYDFDAGGVIAGQVALAGKGLFAHRVEEKDQELTLIKPIQRGVGYVSCDDLVKRKGAAAAHRQAPQAQCHGEHAYSVYLSLSGETMNENTLVEWSDAVLKGLIVGMEGVTLAQAPQILEGDAVITGIKQPEDGSADLIYHLGNYGPGEAYLLFDRPVEPCLLNEEPLDGQPSPLVRLGAYEFGAVRVRKT